MMYLLVADSDADTRVKIKREAEKHGFVVDEALDGIEAIKQFRRREYDVVVLDSFLPELDGILVSRQIRKTSEVPILFLTGKGKEYDRLAGFDAGADDYVLKPFYPSELFARIRAILNRCLQPQKRVVLHAGGISLNPSSHAVYVDERQVKLAPREFDLLCYLMQNQNLALSRETLLNQVWGEDFEGTDRTVDTHIKTLREQLKPYGSHIKTVWGYGYKLEK